jgi:hypothetical protein
MIALGAPQINVRMQEPLTDARAVGYNQNDAVNQTVIFMQNLRNRHAGIRIPNIEAYPYNNGDLLRWWIQVVTSVSQSVGIQPPDAFELDHDIVLSGVGTGVWADIAWMQNVAHAWSWQFGVIFCATYPNPPSDWEFDNEVMSRGYYYRQNQIVPDNYVIESWEHTAPTLTVPEGSAYTFMYDAAVFRNNGYFPR